MNILKNIKDKLIPPKAEPVAESPQQAIVINESDPDFIEKFFSQMGLSDNLTGLCIDTFAINVAVNIISGLIAKCDFVTYDRFQPLRGEEAYLWNVQPNINQNSTQFIQEFVQRLLTKNECLIFVWNNQIIISEAFNKQEYALLETIFDSVYRKGFSFKKKFPMSEVLYFRLNNSDVAQLFRSLYSGYDKIISQAMERYKQSGGEKIILKISTLAESEDDYEEKLQKLMTERFKTYFANRNAVLPLTEGFEVDRGSAESSKKASNEVTDINSLVDAALSRAAQAFRIPPALMKGDTAADMDIVMDNMLTMCIDPLADLIGEEITRKRYGKDAWIKGNYIKVDTSCIKHIDIFSVAEKVDKYIADGVYNVDEIRTKLGDHPLNTEYSKQYRITKNYETVEKVEGGEKK